MSKTLVAARKLIAKPEHWCKGALAKTKYRKVTVPDSKSAVRWCAVGAIEFASLGVERRFEAAVRRLEFEISDDPLSVWNDWHTHADVLELFDRAIKRSRR